MYNLKRIDLIENEDLFCKESICKNNAVFILEKEINNGVKSLGTYCNFHSIINKDYYEWKENIVWMNVFIWIPIFWLLIYIPTLKIGKSNIVLKYQSQYNRRTDGGNLELFHEQRNSKKLLQKLEGLKGYKISFWVFFILSFSGQLIGGISELFISFISNNFLYPFSIEWTIILYLVSILFGFLYIIFGIKFYKNKTKQNLLLFIFFATLAMSKPFIGPYGFASISVLIFVTIFIAFGFYRAINIVEIQNNSKVKTTILNIHLVMTILYIIGILTVAGVESLFISFNSVYDVTIYRIFNPLWTITFTLSIMFNINLYISNNKRTNAIVLLILSPFQIAFTPFIYFGVLTVCLFIIVQISLNISILRKYKKTIF